MSSCSRCELSIPCDVLLVGPLPPPPLLGGIETGVEMLIASDLAVETSMRLYNTARAHDPARTLFARVRYQLRAFVGYVGALLGRPPTIVHVKASFGVNFYQAAVYVCIARLLRRRVLLQLHSGGFPDFYNGSSRFGRAAIRFALRVPQRIVALSEQWAEYFRALAGVKSVGVVCNATHVSDYASAVPDRGRFGIPGDRLALLFMTTRSRELDVAKGIQELIPAVADIRRTHPDLLLVIAGKISHERELTAALGSEGDGWMSVGTVVGDAKPILYRSVDLFALPSHYENMPNSLLESMAASLPAVATPVGAIPEMIQHGVNGLICPVRDAPALTRCLQRLVSEADLRDSLGAEAARSARERYDFPVLEQQLAVQYRVLALDRRAIMSEASHAPLWRRFASPSERVVWYRRAAVQKRVRLARRLASMSVGEVSHRLGQVTNGWRSKLEHDASMTAALSDWSPREALPSSMYVDPSAYLADRVATKGFFDPADRERLVSFVERHLAGDVQRTLREADDILSDGIELLGRRFRPADADFDWLADPDHGRVWPLRALAESSAVRDVEADIKHLWEVNRHQYLVTLARAYAYSGEQRYSTACKQIIERWTASNPYPVGVNWASNLEVAVRALSWVWALHYLVGTPALDAQEARTWLTSLRRHRDHIVANLSIYTDPTNHLIGEASALAVLTMWLPELPDSTELRARALDILGREISIQVSPDGVSREQATSYQRFVLDFLLQVIRIADRNGIGLPPNIRGYARSMLEVVSEFVGADGRAPRIGDSDDARAIPFFTADPWDFDELLALGEGVVGRGVAPGRALRATESVVWLTGIEGYERVATQQAPVQPRSSVLLHDGGYAILRDPERPEANRLLFDCGPLGFLPHASHGHADLLSILVDVGGEELLVDPGTFAYQDRTRKRTYFRSTRAHNTLEVGGYDQADPFDRFKWLNFPNTAINSAQLGSGFDYVEAHHDGYTRLRPAVRHRRGVLGVGGGWLVIDWLEGRGRADIARWLHAVPNAALERISDQSVRLWTPSRQNSLLLTDVVGAEDGEGARLEDTLSPYSERYGSFTLSPTLCFTDRLELPAVRVMLLATENGSAPANRLTVERQSVAHRDGSLGFRLVDTAGSVFDVIIRPPSPSSRTLDGGVQIVVARRDGLTEPSAPAWRSSPDAAAPTTPAARATIVP